MVSIRKQITKGSETSLQFTTWKVLAIQCRFTNIMFFKPTNWRVLTPFDSVSNFFLPNKKVPQQSSHFQSNVKQLGIKCFGCISISKCLLISLFSLYAGVLKQTKLVDQSWLAGCVIFYRNPARYYSIIFWAQFIESIVWYGIIIEYYYYSIHATDLLYSVKL